MKRAEILEKIEQEVYMNAYNGAMYEEIASLGFEKNLMEYKANIENGKAFGKMDIYKYISGRDASSIFQKGSEEAIKDAKKADYNIIKMLNKLGIDGEWYYNMMKNI